MYTVILRPGLVYHDTERPWSYPLGQLSNIASKLSKKVPVLPDGPPGTDLRILADVTIKEAMQQFIRHDDMDQ